MKTKVIIRRGQSALAAGLLLLMAGLPANPAWAADGKPPERLSYQGNVTDSNGVPLGNDSPKNYDVIFRIYSGPQGGSSSWAEQQTVTIDKGYFSVLLGEGSSVGSELHNSLSTVFTGSTASDRYIGITVKIPNQADIEIAPRLRFLTSPYAFLASNAKSMVANDGTTVLYASSGKIGIKKDNPGTELDVAGAVTATSFSGGGAGLTGLNANNMTAGILSSSRIPGLDTSKITTGVFDVNRIPNLDASKISGTFNGNIIFSANVGIGTTSPTAKLHVANGGIKLEGANTFEFGAGIGTKQSDAGKIGYGVWTADALDIVGGGVDQPSRKIKMWAEGGVTLSGGLGIGVTTPARSFHVNSGSDGIAARIESTSNAGSWLALGNSSTGGKFWHLISTGSGNGEGAGKLLIGSGDSDGFTGIRMTVQNDGKVGIGTTSPSAPLEVSGTAVLTKSYGYLNVNGNIGTSSGANGYSIIASGRIGGSEINAFSDARIKDVRGRSDTQKDLRTIQKLQVTDYVPVDKVADGTAVRKGFIAQEVESVIPEAVTTTRRFVPNVYAAATELSLDKDGQFLKLTLPKPHDLRKGDRVQVFADDARLEFDVAEVPSPNQITLSKCNKQPEKLFVYGKEVADFRVLNYDRIFTTGIGAVQELAKEVENLRSQQARMAELEAKASRVDALEREIGELRKVVARLAEGLDKVQTAAAHPKRAPDEAALKVSLNK